MLDMYEGIEEDLSEDDPYADSLRLELVLGAYLADVDGDPSTLVRVVTEASDPSIDEQLADGGVRLRTRLPAHPDMSTNADLPAVDLLLDLDADRRPVLARFTAEAGTASSRVEVRFSGWGEAIGIDAPAESDIDRTPWISEEAIAALDPTLVVAPSVAPEGMELVAANVWDAGGIEGCPI